MMVAKGKCMLKSIRLAVASVSIALFAASAARAQALADQVQADAVAYFGWRGTLDPGAGYANSHLAAVLKDSRFIDFVDQTLPAMGVAIGQRSPEYRSLAMASLDVIRAAIRHPTAVFETTADGKPRVAICIRGGEDSKTLIKSMQALAEQLPLDMAPAARQEGDLAILTFNYAADALVLSTESTGSLATSPAFKAAISRGVADPAVVTYADAKALRAMIDGLVHSEAAEASWSGYTKAMDASGLSGVRSFAYVAGFDGRDWRTDIFVDAPQPRTGLLALSESKPFSPDLLKRVPADAYGVTALRLDPAKLVATIRSIAIAANPQAGDLFDKALGAATIAIGKNVQTDLLEPLGDEWAVYNAPEVAGSGPSGAVLVNKLDNPLKEKQALYALTTFLSNSARTFLGRKGINITSHTTQIDGMTISYFGTPVFSPAWTIKDGYLYVGLYPQAVLEAARYNGRSIGESDAFAQSRKAVGGNAPAAFSFTDTRATMPDGYATALLLGRTALGFNEMFLAPTNEPFFPPLGPVMAEAAPVGTAAWGDEAGLHWRSHSPYPGAEGVATLSLSSLYIQNTSMMVSILLPSLNRAREAANRIKSASNLRQIGLAAKMFANEQPRTQALPPDCGSMLAEEISPEVFLNPRLGHTLPPEVAKMSPQQKAAWVNAHSDYVWLGKGLNDSVEADRPLAYEKPDGLDDGVNMLYGDTHVDWLTMQSAKAELAKVGVTFP